MVAEYVALKSAVAFVFPTPAISNELHVSVRSVLTAQRGLGVPVTRCAPVGPLSAIEGNGGVRTAVGLVAVSEQAATARAIKGSSVSLFMVCLLGHDQVHNGFPASRLGKRSSRRCAH